MTDKEKIRAEIERLKEAPYLTEEHALIGYDCALSDVLSIIDSIPDHFADVDKMGEPQTRRSPKESGDLKEAARLYAIPPYMKDIDVHYIEEYPYNPGLEAAFIAGAEWQKKRFEAEYELDWITDLKKDLYELGRKDEREQMMKEAVEAEVKYFGETQGVPRTIKIPRMQEWLKPFKDGDKVKIIIIKDDENIND